MHIAAIMPCRGRAEQTVANVKRLLTTAGYEGWRLVVICDGDRDVYQALSQAAMERPVPGGEIVQVIGPDGNGQFQRHGYWSALDLGSMVCPSATHFVNLANDLLPGQHWLRRAAEAYRETFGAGDGMLGFNDGHHEVGHSCHFLISRSLLDRYGGWPVWYDHNYGDTELCQRAIADGVYAKAPWATLYHDHPYFGGDDDAVYREGRAQMERDRRLYEQRRRAGCPKMEGADSTLTRT